MTFIYPGGSALTSAVQSSDRKKIAIAKLLIENGADLNVENKYHNTPLSLAINRGSELGVALLVKNGALVPAGMLIDAAFNG